MERKIEKSYEFNELGFPIILTNVPMIKVRNEFILDIDYNHLQNAVLMHLCYKKTPLTGNEVKFIRKFFSLTTTEFGYRFGYTHAAVIKWENQRNEIARITPTTEIYLRLFILEFLDKSAKDFKELYKEIQISELAKYLKKSSTFVYSPISINAKKELVA